MTIQLFVTILLIIAACVVLYNLIVTKKGDQPVLRKLFAYAGSLGGTVTHHDHLFNLAVGISDFNMLYFFKKTNDEEIYGHVNLADVRQCTVKQSVMTGKDGKSTATERIELVFHCKEKTKPDVKFEFYNLKHDGLSIGGEFQLAKNWHKLITSRLELMESVPC